ncbi:MAG: prepilin peptidase [Bacilli bacterium]|nr:prepilin peptidase [Bacilli bacterium]
MDTIMILMYFYVFVVGMCIASFMNVVIYRVPNHLDFVKGRSFCPKCHTTLKPYDMIPVLSWIILRGKCRNCKVPISGRYPLIELSGGILAVLIFHHYLFSWDTILVFLLSMILLAIAMIDIDTMEIANGFIILCFICAIIFMLLHPEMSIFSRMLGFFIISLPMYLLNLIVNDSFGGGDIKLMAVCGFMLGTQNTLLAAFIAILLAGTYAVYLIITKRLDKKDHIAFGPYLCIGILIAMMYGTQIINAYLSLFYY